MAMLQVYPLVPSPTLPTPARALSRQPTRDDRQRSRTHQSLSISLYPWLHVVYSSGDPAMVRYSSPFRLAQILMFSRPFSNRFYVSTSSTNSNPQ